MPPSAPRPRWYAFAWFLGRPPPLTSRQWRVLGLVAAVSFFETYDLYLLALNLKQIQADLGIPDADIGYVGSLIRAGALFAIIPAMLADRVGRRRMLLVTIVMYTLLTGATAFAQTTEVFVALQFFARLFAVAETILATVVIVEEFAPEHRGWGIGAAAAIQASGAGFASVLFGFVEVLPYGWRALYLVGLVPLALLTYWRRTLPETERFAERQSAQDGTAPVIDWRALTDGITTLLRRYPRRLLALALLVFVTATAASSAGFMAPKYLQEVHGWSPADVAIMSFIGGAFAIMGNPLAGWLSDRYGRRPVTGFFAIGIGFAAIALYNLSGFMLPVLWMGLIFFSLGTNVTENAYSAEMFPTDQRAAASGTKALVANLGGIAGLALMAALFDVLGSNWASVSVLAAACFLLPLIVMLLPETAGRDLQELAPDEVRQEPDEVRQEPDEVRRDQLR